MSTSEQIFQDAVALPPDARAELAERLIASLANEVSSEITTAQVTEVQRRVAQVESGEVTLIPGDEVLAKARGLLKEHKP
jgi:putative addiction module component (TIGR02574 family)